MADAGAGAEAESVHEHEDEHENDNDDEQVYGDGCRQWLSPRSCDEPRQQRTNAIGERVEFGDLPIVDVAPNRCELQCGASFATTPASNFEKARLIAK